MQRRLGLLLILIPMIASAGFALTDSLRSAPSAPAPKSQEAPKAKPAERNDVQSQTPPTSTGEVIGVPMFA